MDKMFSLATVVGVACLTSLATFGAIYLLWLRFVLKRLVEVQLMLKEVSQHFNQQGKAPLDHGSQVPHVRTKISSVPKLQMCVEGKEIAILEIDGRDVVRFREELSDDQKKRIIKYLKVEGFLTRS